MTNEDALNAKRIDSLDRYLASHFRPKLMAFGAVKDFLLVVVPQMQLAPYVFALLLEDQLLLTRKILLIHNRSRTISYELFRDFPNVIQMDIGYVHNVEEQYIERLSAMLHTFSCEISSAVLHNFAGSVNMRFAQLLADRTFSGASRRIFSSDADVTYYSDGSRNNPLPEVASQKGNDFYHQYYSDASKRSLVYFGFRHHTLRDARREKVLGYDYIQAGFKMLNKLTSFKERQYPDDRSYSVVVSRYWGRDPYFFNELEGRSVDSIFVSAIIEKVSKAHTMLIRDDNRFSASASNIISLLIQENYAVRLFSELFELEVGDSKGLLLENFFFDNPSLLSKCKQFYSFDSSFPLVFQNRELYTYLAHDAELFVGFPIELVRVYGRGECFSVMKKRTVETVFSVYRSGIFNIFDNTSLVLSPYIEATDPLASINASFERGDGCFRLMKP
jgi:hypothetical protein